jgi:hypothetical protein
VSSTFINDSKYLSTITHLKKFINNTFTHTTLIQQYPAISWNTLN